MGEATKRTSIPLLIIGLAFTAGASSSPAAECNGHGICRKYTVTEGDPIQVEVTVDSEEVKAGVTNDLGFRCPGDVVSFHVGAYDWDQHVCDIPRAPVKNYIQATED
jgi:hypothetical protein